MASRAPVVSGSTPSAGGELNLDSTAFTGTRSRSLRFRKRASGDDGGDAEGDRASPPPPPTISRAALEAADLLANAVLSAPLYMSKRGLVEVVLSPDVSLTWIEGGRARPVSVEEENSRKVR